MGLDIFFILDMIQGGVVVEVFCVFRLINGSLKREMSGVEGECSLINFRGGTEGEVR